MVLDNLLKRAAMILFDVMAEELSYLEDKLEYIGYIFYVLPWDKRQVWACISRLRFDLEFVYLCSCIRA